MILSDKRLTYLRSLEYSVFQKLSLEGIVIHEVDHPLSFEE
jgi:hypothetical protein